MAEYNLKDHLRPTRFEQYNFLKKLENSCLTVELSRNCCMSYVIPDDTDCSVGKGITFRRPIPSWKNVSVQLGIEQVITHLVRNMFPVYIDNDINSA